MKNKGMVQDTGAMLVMLLGVVLAIVLGGMTLSYLGVFPGGSPGVSFPGTQPAQPGAPIVTTSVCGADGIGDITVRVKNTANSTTAEWVDAGIHLYRGSGSNLMFVESQTSNPNSTYITFEDQPCETDYTMYVLSSGANGGINNYISQVDSSNGNVNLQNGVVSFRLMKQIQPLTLHITRHSTLQFRMWDNNEGAWVYPSTSSVATAYLTTGVTFMSSTNNETNMSVENGMTFDVNLQVQAVHTAGQFAANGPNSVIIATTADSNSWEDITIECPNTRKITAADLTDNEKSLWSSQDYYHLVDQIFDRNRITCSIEGRAKDSVDSWDCPVFTFATRGNYESTHTGNIVVGSAAEDDSSNTAVYTVQTVTLRTNACT